MFLFLACMIAAVLALLIWAAYQNRDEFMRDNHDDGIM